MSDIVENYLQRLHARLRGDAEQKTAIVNELRAHIEEKIADSWRERPELTREEVAREVLNDLGDADTLAVAYSPQGMELRDRAGEVVVSVGRAVGRGAVAVGRGAVPVVKWLAISLAAFIVLAVGVGIWAFYEVRPYVEDLVEKNAPYPLYSLSCASQGCSADPAGQAFFVHPDAREVRLDVSLWDDRDDRGNGSVHVTLLEPDGMARFDRTFTAHDDGYSGEEVTFAAVPGDWTVRVDFGPTFQGRLDVEVYAIGLPKEARPE